MTTTHLMTADGVKAAVLAVIDAHPDRINPTNGDGQCLYTDPDDPDCHCLIGQVAADQGWQVPGPECTRPAFGAAEEYGWPVTTEAADLLSAAQEYADAPGPSGNSRRWGVIRDRVAAIGADQ